MRTLNLGILAHVDAGKTTLTERLLYAAGVIDDIGSVDDGTTRTDTLALEKERGITIRSAVVSFVVDDVTVNLLDTPGHPDFIAEVERVLNVLDGAVLVISAVEGVQAQTRILMRTLQRLRIPTLIFVNKIDRVGARYDSVLTEIRDKLTRAIVPMGSVRGIGTRTGVCQPYRGNDAEFRYALTNLLTEHDDSLLGTYLDDAVTYRQLRSALAAQTGHAVVHPVFFGSAINGAGVPALISGLTELLPASERDVEAPASGNIFKVERGSAGEKVAYVRMFSGTVAARDRLQLGDDDERKVTAISVFERGTAVSRPSVRAGHIAKLWGLDNAAVGDVIGAARSEENSHHFAPPTLEAVVVPTRAADKGPLHIALAQLAEQDPLINVRQDDIRRETYVSLYGEVQKEVIQATLARDFGIGVTFRDTTTICVERPVASGSAVEFMGEGGNPFRATVGLRIEPAAVNTGVHFALGVELGSMPFAFFKAVEESVTEVLHQGIYGWQVTDCTVTMTHSAFTPPPPYGWSKWSSSAGDFRSLTPLVLMDALQQAGTRVFEPIQRIRLEIPEDTFGGILPVLARLRAVPEKSVLDGSSYVIDGTIPATRVHELQQQLPALTRGEGVLESAFERYEPVDGPVPTRSRSDQNPLDRKEYLLHVGRRL